MKKVLHYFVDCLDYFFYRVCRAGISWKSLLPYDSSAATIIGWCIWTMAVLCIEIVLSILGIQHNPDYMLVLLFLILVPCYFVFKERRYERLLERYGRGIKHKRIKDSIVVLVCVLSCLTWVLIGRVFYPLN